MKHIKSYLGVLFALLCLGLAPSIANAYVVSYGGSADIAGESYANLVYHGGGQDTDIQADGMGSFVRAGSGECDALVQIIGGIDVGSPQTAFNTSPEFYWTSYQEEFQVEVPTRYESLYLPIPQGYYSGWVGVIAECYDYTGFSWYERHESQTY